MDTHFAPAERTDPRQLRELVDLILDNGIMAGLLKSARGVTAVLNEQRQVLAVNQGYLEMLGIEDPEEVLGLRPGEMLGCANARGWPGGCGTTPACPACGAVLAILGSLEEMVPVEKNCALRVIKDGTAAELCFRVRSVPVELDEHRLLLVFMQDITEQQERLSLARVFLHDINNLAMILAGAEELMRAGNLDPDSEDGRQNRDRVERLAERLLKVIQAQRSLLALDDGDFSPSRSGVKVGDLLAEIRDLFASHESAAGIVPRVLTDLEDLIIRTDPALVHRILSNMVINACEASEEGDEVEVGVQETAEGVRFRVHNQVVMPPHVAGRVFQRHFSTKHGDGRGLGTYSMKVLAEEFLGGKVDFQSRPGLGTTFTLTLPG